MPKNLTDVAAFEAPIAVPVDADTANAASVEAPFQQLANRTAYLRDVQTKILAHDIALGSWTSNAVGGTGNLWSDVAFDGSSTWVIVGVQTPSTGKINSSSDLVTWTDRAPSGSPGQLNACAYGAGIFVAVGNSGAIQTSPDGSTWTARTAGGSYSGNLRAVLWDGVRFVAAGDNGEIQVSSDGVTWTSATISPSTTDDVQDLAFDGTTYVAVTNTARAYTTTTPTTGSSWVSRATGASGSPVLGHVTSVGEGVFFASNEGSVDELLRSEDSGATWSAVITSGLAGGAPASIGSDGALMLVCAGFARFFSALADSPDGWLQRATSGLTQILRIRFLGSGWVRVGSGTVVETTARLHSVS